MVLADHTWALLVTTPLGQVCLKYYEYEFMELACQCPAVVCCRCAPTQKAQIVRLLQERTGKLTCAVGKFAWVVGVPLGRRSTPELWSGLLGWWQSTAQGPILLALSCDILSCRCPELTFHKEPESCCYEFGLPGLLA